MRSDLLVDFRLTAMNSNPELDLTIGSSFEELEIVDTLMEVVGEWVELSEEAASAVGLAVREAAANAVQHGNRLEKDRKVGISARLEPRELVVIVRDEGDGFDPEALPDPLAPPNLLKPSGRGIFLMRRFMDAVIFEFPPEGGTVVTMRLALEPNGNGDGSPRLRPAGAVG